MSLEDSSIHDDLSMGLNEGPFVLPNDSDILQTIDNEEEMLLGQINIGCPNIEENERRVLLYMSKNVDNELQNVSLMDFINTGNEEDNTPGDIFLPSISNNTASNEFELCDIPLRVKLKDTVVQEAKTDILQETDCNTQKDLLQHETDGASFPNEAIDNECIENEDDINSQANIWDTFVEKIIVTRYKCKLCTLNFETLLEVQAHLISTHTKPIQSSKDDQPNQISTHSPTPLETSCSHDDTSLQQQQQQTPVKSKRKPKVKLKAESKVFASTSKRKKGKNKRVRFACDWPECDYVGATSSHIRDHRRVHTKERPFQCDWIDCGQSFNQMSTLRTHLRVHTGEKPWTCTVPTCNKSFSQKSNLTAHLLRHTGVKNFHCDWPECGQQFATKANLEGHLKGHQNVKLFACDWPGCTARYTVNSHLRFHQLVHQEDKAVACDWPDCTYRCHRRFDMKLHKLSVHNGAKNYVCQLCPKRYSRPSHLSVHVKKAHASLDNSQTSSNSITILTTTIEPSSELLQQRP